jgi:hypothetical protein
MIDGNAGIGGYLGEAGGVRGVSASHNHNGISFGCELPNLLLAHAGRRAYGVVKHRMRIAALQTVSDFFKRHFILGRLRHHTQRAFQPRKRINLFSGADDMAASRRAAEKAFHFRVPRITYDNCVRSIRGGLFNNRVDSQDVRAGCVHHGDSGIFSLLALRGRDAVAADKEGAFAGLCNSLHIENAFPAQQGDDLRVVNKLSAGEERLSRFLGEVESHADGAAHSLAEPGVFCYYDFQLSSVSSGLPDS